MLRIRIAESLTCRFWEPKYFISIYDNVNNTGYAIGRFWTLSRAKKHREEIKSLIEFVNKERTINQFEVKNERD